MKLCSLLIIMLCIQINASDSVIRVKTSPSILSNPKSPISRPSSPTHHINSPTSPRDTIKQAMRKASDERLLKYTR